MALFPRSRATVGLDIGSGYIKAVTINHGSGKPVLERVAIAKVADDAIVEGEVMDPTLVADAVRGLLGKSSSKSRDVVVAIGGRDVIIKKIQMDRMKDTEAREVIRWEADQHVPFDPENVELDFQILDPDGDGLQMQVLLVAAKRELVESKLALLAEIGMDASVIDVEAFALHNAFEWNYPEAMRGVVALANVGHETTTVNLLEDGVPVLTRDLPIGVRRLREDLQRERSLAADVADRIVRGTELDPALAPHVTSRGEELALGVERATAFLQTSNRPVGSLARLYITGGGSRVPGLAGVLADRLRVPVTPAHPVERLDVAPDAFEGLSMDEVAPLLMLPVGLALRVAA
ncbi:MAG TPA: type IV pilus assembly protein PilM [Gemmatimonadales bacterium]|jgi:type IV pilus assembly protein PilM|nr:type IV pilus assembly protein PilM [Gemmatimonadales bacterium]